MHVYVVYIYIYICTCIPARTQKHTPKIGCVYAHIYAHKVFFSTSTSEGIVKRSYFGHTLAIPISFQVLKIDFEIVKDRYLLRKLLINVSKSCTGKQFKLQAKRLYIREIFYEKKS